MNMASFPGTEVAGKARGKLLLWKATRPLGGENAAPSGFDWVFEHAVRVCDLAMATAATMGLSESLTQRIGAAALLHDVGKWRVGLELVNKAAALTAPERLDMQRHAAIGAQMIEQLGEDLGLDLSMEREVALLHHERWDGGGYPRGLRGREIPFAARLVGLVDLFDALVSARPYKSAIGPVVALDFICTHSGILFDPDCVMAFAELQAIRPLDSPA